MPTETSGHARPCELALPTAVSTLAAAMAQCLSDRELSLAAAILTQLGDTLATIAVQRSLSGGGTGSA